MHKKIASSLLHWYREEGRSYPFRKTTDPYRILVCEMLLRKTTAKQVANIYNDFFSKFPTVEHLSRASIEQVAEVIRPLGIVSRARDLLEAARTISLKYRGEVPEDDKALRALRGVGRYVANCVLALGYGKPSPMVDTNVNRVLSRILNLQRAGRDESEKIWQAYSELAPKENLREFHYALIDFSHTICRAKNPKCHQCPLNNYCKYYSEKPSE